MKKEVTIVPKNTCPLKIIRELGDSVKNSWIFLSDSALKYIMNLDSCKTVYSSGCYTLTIDGTEKFPPIQVTVSGIGATDWWLIRRINATNHVYGVISYDPERIFFLKMEE